ncbi:hypothetical protein LTR36_005789 [Oleoguttula mirabilis]|uniref:J domain-containing protein n=1 Tax=Oleoguttula mirabilis TaxID=1507867 RepID=A0AAV9JEM9_9PEZI|nr:hypothetical protein LTR36_005789 [Oleoguttula mirabilis]
MVKADVKHNYYADLELPTTCSIDDVKKQYRKLALLYHPDRNAGQEEEYVPKFQGIQTAHEILGDQITKAKYDADRRKAGLYPSSTGQTFRANQPAPGNPYAANSAYPPPPRRTQPGTWQRPQPQQSPQQPQQPSGSTPSGADRFTNFPRTAPTARKDPAQDRTNMFRAWQNMNNAQERQQRHTPGGPGAAPAPQPSPNRPERPRPPPRQDTRMPSEDEIRAGMNYRKPPPPPQSEAETAGRGQSAWADFQQKNAGKPGLARSNTNRTPKKQGGFDPNAPGSDERPAGQGGYAKHRHRSEDFGQPQQSRSGQPFPPPPPGPPPQSPLSPSTSPSNHRPFGDPLRPFKSRTTDEEVSKAPYSEGNRKSTPYSSFIGEKTHFRRDSSDGLRRSASTRDTTKLSPNGGSGRARSTSPLGRQQKTKSQSQNGANKLNVDYSDSDASDGRPTSTTPEEYDGATATPADIGRRPGTAPHSTTPFERPKKVPTPPSTHFNKSTNPSNPPPTVDGAQSDTERPGMQQQTSNNMYVKIDPLMHDVFSHSPFSPGQWAAQMFGTHTTSRAKSRMSGIPSWAIPSSVQPGSKARGEPTPPKPPKKKEKPALKVDVRAANATPDQQAALGFVRSELARSYGEAPDTLDMDVFLKLASTAVEGQTSGNTFLDSVLSRAFFLFPTVATIAFTDNRIRTLTDKRSRTDSFTFPVPHDMFTPNGKSRSEEHINTKFSPEGWSGTFQGSSDYFAPPQSPVGRKPSSPFRREKSGLRSATTHVPPTNGASRKSSDMPPPPRPAGADGQQQAEGTPGEVKFSKEQWEKTFQDASWTWPPPPPQPSSPGKTAAKARTPARKASRSSARSAASGTREQPQVVDEDDTVEVEGVDGRPEHGAPVPDDGDAMDIDTTPPAQHNEKKPEVAEVEKGKEPRLYSVPLSDWRQRQQQGQANGHRRNTSSRTSADANLTTNLDDLANVEPMAQGANGLKNLADLSSTLPFQSQPSAAPPTHPLEPQKLQVPSIPKAPEPPNQLTKQSWHAFTQAFGNYLKAYHAFNNTMLQHFLSREHQAQARLVAGTGWLEATGDTSGARSGGNGPSGFGSYLQGVREDETVREAWGVGCERHVEACKGFEKMRERVRRLVAAGGLVEH